MSIDLELNIDFETKLHMWRALENESVANIPSEASASRVTAQ